MNPKVTLVGAGPGDPELITIKGWKVLSEADVVLYDALVDPRILSHVPETAIKVFVGKRAGSHSHSQESINRLIVEYANKYGHVVRLKGGDPFVFGRGQEEIEYAEKEGLSTAVIPGISSAIGVSTLQKIPLTVRGVSESIWIITGTTDSHQLSEDLKLAAMSSATVVILMGRKKLKEITEAFQIEGRGSLPVAIIEKGSMKDEKVVLGIIDNINQKVEEEEVGTPAVIIIGEVVKLHPEFLFDYLVNNYLK